MSCMASIMLCIDYTFIQHWFPDHFLRVEVHREPLPIRMFTTMISISYVLIFSTFTISLSTKAPVDWFNENVLSVGNIE